MCIRIRLSTFFNVNFEIELDKIAYIRKSDCYLVFLCGSRYLCIRDKLIFFLKFSLLGSYL